MTSIFARYAHALSMRVTRYFLFTRNRPGREFIEFDWIERVVHHHEREVVQTDGRIRRWARIPEAGGRFLRVVLLTDGETVHNAFFDRGYRP